MKRDILEDIFNRRDRLRSGMLNGIPTPFTRFHEDFPLICRGRSYGVTASTKGAKSQFVNWLFVFNVLEYAYANQDKVRVKIVYYSLEEQPEDLFKRWICYLLRKRRGWKVSLSELNSDEVELRQEVLNEITSDGMVALMDWYEESVSLRTESRPEVIIRELEDDLAKEGEVVYEDVEDELGEMTKVPKSYKPHDDKLYFISVIDHVSLLSEMPGKDLRQTLVWFSREYNVRMRNFYKCIPVCVQQQDFAGDRQSSKEASKGEPTRAGASDSKYLARDLSMLIGVYAPSHFGVPEYLGYDIMRLKDRCRFISVLANRHGVIGGKIGMRFIGECAWFEELPKPGDQRLEEYYEMVDIYGRKAIARKPETTEGGQVLDSLFGDKIGFMAIKLRKMCHDIYCTDDHGTKKILCIKYGKPSTAKVNKIITKMKNRWVFMINKIKKIKK